MELRQLSYFTTIVNEGNISQAAKKLNISQPPLSHQMKLLEAELGVTLFERGSRRIRLTPAGKTFYDRALAILDLSQAARTELTAQKQEIQGIVRLGIISSAVEFVTGIILPHSGDPILKPCLNSMSPIPTTCSICFTPTRSTSP